MKRKSLSLDRKTTALAGVAAVTVSGVFIGEAISILRKRKKRGLPPNMKEVPLKGYQETPSGERLLFTTLSGFLFGFVTTRGISLAIRKGFWPMSNVYIQKRHIHHFLPGIILAYTSSIIAITTKRDNYFLSFLAGTGMGMTFDEASLLLELRDVYWSEEGLFSLQSSFILITLLSGAILLGRIFKRGERIVEEKSSPE